MIIKTIGTGDITVRQHSACTLIDGKILIDCGNGTLKTLLEQNVDIGKIEAILITHQHGDHIVDIPFLITYRFIKHINNKLTIYCPKGVIKAIYTISDTAFPDLERLSILAEACNTSFIEFEQLDGELIADDYKATSFPVHHGSLKNVFAYVINSDGKAVGISGDSCYCESIDSIMKQVDAAVLDVCGAEGSTSHMGVHDIVRLSETYQDVKIITTHMNDTSRTELTSLEMPNVIVPEDGQEVVI